MSCMYTATVVIGCKIPNDVMRELCDNTTKDTRGCSHPIVFGARFCPECGTSTWVKGCSPSPYDYLKSKSELKDLMIVQTADEQYFVGFRGYVSESMDLNSFHYCKAMKEPTGDDLAKMKTQLMEKLGAFGLWKDHNFGIWLVAYVG